MSETSPISYLWNEYLQPLFVAIPFMPFLLLAFALDRQLAVRVPDRAVRTIKISLLALLAILLAVFLFLG